MFYGNLKVCRCVVLELFLPDQISETVKLFVLVLLRDQLRVILTELARLARLPAVKHTQW